MGVWVLLLKQEHSKTFDQIKKIELGEKKFKNIFENIEDPILIVEGKKGKYVNDSFLLLFKD